MTSTIIGKAESKHVSQFTNHSLFFADSCIASMTMSISIQILKEKVVINKPVPSLCYSNNISAVN